MFRKVILCRKTRSFEVHTLKNGLKFFYRCWICACLLCTKMYAKIVCKNLLSSILDIAHIAVKLKIYCPVIIP